MFSVTFPNWFGNKNCKERLQHDLQVLESGEDDSTRVNITVLHRGKAGDNNPK